MSGPKLIFVNRVYWPSEAATAQLLSDLAEGLAGRGHAVHVIASGDGPASHRGVSIHRTGGDARHRGAASQLGNYFRFLHRARFTLQELVAPGDVVVFKTDPPLLGAALTRCASGRGAHVVQWIQDIYPEILPEHYGAGLSPFVWPLRRWRDQAWRRSSACVVVGEDMRPALAAAGVSSARSHLQANWAPRELEQPAHAADIARLRRAWRLEDKFIVAYSGNLGRVHEFETLLAAADQLRRAPMVAFLFVGGGPRLAEVRARVAELALDNVHFQPPVARADLPASLAAADLHAVTLRPGFERWVNPSKLAGILAAGRPALFIGPDRGAIARLLHTGEAGLSFPPGDAAPVARAIQELRSQTDLVARLRAGARRTFLAHFQFEGQLAAWDRLLRSLPPS